MWFFSNLFYFVRLQKALQKPAPTDNLEIQGVLGHQNTIISGLRKENDALKKENSELRRQIVNLKRAHGSTGAAMYTGPDYGAENERFDYDGHVTVPVFVNDGDASTPALANAVLDDARVETQPMKNVYPIQLVKAALSIAPYDEARYNNEGLSPSKLWEQEYMVFHASDPNKAVRLNMKDIQLADDQ